jgi:hypothetical protein
MAIMHCRTIEIGYFHVSQLRVTLLYLLFCVLIWFVCGIIFSVIVQYMIGIGVFIIHKLLNIDDFEPFL